MDDVRELLRNEAQRVGELDDGLEGVLRKVVRRQRRRGLVLGIVAGVATAAVVAGLWVGLTGAPPATPVSPRPHPSVSGSPDAKHLRAELRDLIRLRTTITRASRDAAVHEAQLVRRATRLRTASPGETASRRQARLGASERVEARLASLRAMEAELAARLRDVDARITQLRARIATGPAPVRGRDTSDVRCAPSQFRIRPGADGAGPRVIPEFDLLYVKGPSCTVRLRATLTLLDVHGHSLPIEGNHITAVLARRLPPQELGLMWSWANWCRAQQVVYHLAIAGRTYEWPAETRPECLAPEAGSSLSPIRVRPSK